MNSPSRRPGERHGEGTTRRGTKDDARRHDQGIVRDKLGQEQPADKERAQQTSNAEEGAGQPPSPGQPAGGE